MHWPGSEKPWPRSRPMNEPFDPLEAELAALEPRQPSASLAQRITECLERDTSHDGAVNAIPRAIRRVLGWTVIATVAASLLVAVAQRRGENARPTPPTTDRLQPPLANAF